MQLFPINVKYKKQHRRRRQLTKKEVNYVAPLQGFAGIKAINSTRITSVQIEASRKVIAKYIRKKYKNKLRFCIFPDLPITKKSTGVRMGKGKGNIDFWCFPVLKGRILFEINKNVVPSSVIFKAFNAVGQKLSCSTKILL